MNAPSVSDTWAQGSPYEQYIGRWSRRIAPGFLAWLNVPAGRRWVDVGCGTGALSAAILDHCAPASVTGVEPSDGFLKLALRNLGAHASLLSGSAAALPLDSAVSDVVVSALVLNFLPDLRAALAEMLRVTVSGGTIAAYVWDYADRMQMLRMFWDTAAALDPAAASLHEGRRFPLCNPSALQTAFAAAGLERVDTTALDIVTGFAGFDEYWQPFLGGQGPAPAYVMSLADAQRAALRNTLQARMPVQPDGSVTLTARAWAVRGAVP